jgi:cytochrome c oxidase subunit 3
MTALASTRTIAFTRKSTRNTGHIPGNLAIWAAILAEMSEFAVMFVVYFLAKVHNPEVFAIGPLKLNTLAGTVNTLVMLTSSFFVIRAVIAMRADKPAVSARWLWGAAISGGIYLLVKYFEYRWNTAHAITVETNLFYAVYYYVTFNHFLHVGWGTAAIIWVIYRINAGAYSHTEHEGLINIAVYWHMIDLAWITIFPLLYVIR